MDILHNNERGKRHREKHRDRFNAYHRAYRLITPNVIEKMLIDPNEYLFERDPRKREILRRSTPPWADRSAIRRVYESYVDMAQRYPFPLWVIHGYPCTGRGKICGLHVAENLFVVSETLRAIWKQNPMEWMRVRS